MARRGKNVYGRDMIPCSTDPMTGFFRDGCCNTSGEDAGMHLVCAVMTEAFLRFSKSRGNDLSTPMPEYQFPGLEAGDRWCLCVLRWKEAWQSGMAPQVLLEATHISTLEFVSLDVLEEYAVDT